MVLYMYIVLMLVTRFYLCNCITRNWRRDVRYHLLPHI